MKKNYYKIFHGERSNKFSMAAKTVYGRETLNKFQLTEMKATCVICNLQINIENIDKLTADVLIQLAAHHFSHDRPPC